MARDFLLLHNLLLFGCCFVSVVRHIHPRVVHISAFCFHLSRTGWDEMRWGWGGGYYVIIMIIISRRRWRNEEAADAFSSFVLLLCRRRGLMAHFIMHFPPLLLLLIHLLNLFVPETAEQQQRIGKWISKSRTRGRLKLMSLNWIHPEFCKRQSRQRQRWINRKWMSSRRRWLGGDVKG